MFLPGIAFTLLSLPWVSTAEASGHQSPLLSDVVSSTPTTDCHERIANIGAGIGGASAAWNIHKYNRNRTPQRITIFERESTVGGRIRSVYLYPGEGALKVIEDGATRFYTDDWCLTSAMEDVGLKRKEPWPTSERRDDNARTNIKCNAESTAWKDILYGRWKYGHSWQLLRSAKWPFNSIVEELQDVGIDEIVYDSAATYLRNLTVLSALQNQFIQPCARGRSSRELSDVSGLSALMAAGKVATTSVEDGNSRLIERMIRLSEAEVQLGSVVTSITPGFSRRYRLSISPLTPNEPSNASDAEFDVVILAAPLLSYGLDVGSLNLHRAVSPTRYIETHVTHFSSPFGVTSNLSILPLDVNIKKDDILTSSATAENLNLLNVQESSACFTRGCLPGDDCDQCDEDEILCRVNSREYVEDDDIIRMIGRDPKENTELSDYGVHFVHRRVWPYAYPQRREGDSNMVNEVEIAPDMFYLNGAETIVSSMEMSSRMGRNVAEKVTGYGQGLRL